MRCVRSAGLVATLLASGVFVLAGCGFYGDWMFTFEFITPDRAESEETQTFDVPDGAPVTISNDIGSTRISVDPSATEVSVEITRVALAATEEEADELLAEMAVTITEPNDASEALVITAAKPESATGDEGNFNFTVTDDEIHIQSIMGSVQVVQYKLKITLPPGHAVDATQKIGHLTAVALDTAATLRSEAGSIRAIGTETALAIETEAGNVDVDSHEGSLDIESEAGNIDVKILALAADDVVDIDVEAGNVDMELPTDIGATLQAQTALGHVSFDEDDFDDYDDDVIDTFGYAKAVLNGGGATIDIRIDIGEIDIDSF